MKPSSFIGIASLIVLAASASGGQFDGAGSGGMTNKTLQLALQSAQLSDAVSAVHVHDAVSDGASYIARWQKRTFGNGDWFFTRIHGEAFGRRIGTITEPPQFGRGGGTQVQWKQQVYLAHRNPAPGESDLTGQSVKFRIKLKAKGRWRALGMNSSSPGQPDHTTSAEYRLSGHFPTSGTFYVNISGDDPEQTFEREEWMPTTTVTVGPSGQFLLQYSMSIAAYTVNRPGQTQGDAFIAADFVISGFQVLALNNSLIWEYASNVDGSPGDRFTMSLVSAGGTAFPMGLGAAPPAISLRQGVSGNPEVDYDGILQQSDDLIDWRDVVPQPPPPSEVSISSTRQFFRARGP
ncbi:MAG: hypothetical protein IPK22_25065 [Verrucomicrobiaceae bacterium]|nr:hypothetical protein [Verrucomicrobiaceae bacterium]